MIPETASQTIMTPYQQWRPVDLLVKLLHHRYGNVSKFITDGRDDF